MKSFSTALKASYAYNVTTIASCAKIQRLDGVTYTFTNFDKDLVIDTDTYVSSYAFNPTAYTSALGLQIENMEIEGAVDSLGIYDIDIIKNLFYGAVVWFFSVDYKDISAGKDKILYGTIGEIEVSDKTFKFEVRGFSKRYETLYAQYYGKLCRARLGDSKCQVDLANLYTLTGTVNVNPNETSLLTTYIKLDIDTNLNNSEVQITDVLFYDRLDNLIAVKSINTFDQSADLRCSDGLPRALTDLLDNDISTFVCLNTNSSSDTTSLLFEFYGAVNISKLIIKDNSAYNTGYVRNVTIHKSFNGYTWYSVLSILSSTYRSGNIITIPIGALLTPDGTTRFRFISNDVANSGQVDNYYQYGNIKWLTGLNTGLQIEVLQSDTSGHVELALAMPYDIQGGDTFEMTPGCNHLLIGRDGTTSSGHCLTKFNNVINFRGEPYLPNEDVLLSGYIAIKEAREQESSEEPISLEPVQ